MKKDRLNRYIIATFLIFSFSILSCNNQQLQNKYTILRKEYFEQRFENRNNDSYIPVEAATTGINHNDLELHDGVDGYYWSPVANEQLEKATYSEDYSITDITSYEDIKIHTIYKETSELYILNFLYKGKGASGGWFRSNHVLFFYNESIRTGIYFKGLFAPEVFYQGKFYYFYEALSLEIISIEDLNLSNVEIPNVPKEMEEDLIYTWSFYCAIPIEIDYELFPDDFF